MNQLDKVKKLIFYLTKTMPEYASYSIHFPKDYKGQRMWLRSLMNLFDPHRQLDPDFFPLQDSLLSEEATEKGIVDVKKLPTVHRDSRMVLWQGDITRLQTDAIVNAANSGMLGCFVPCHACIDNAIHSAAGLQLRQECFELMKKQGQEEPTGQAKITKAYNLPAKYVIHTVGPIIHETVADSDKELLASCYRSCMETADIYHLKSIAFCCISTGEFHFPNALAAAIALQTISDYFAENPHSTIERVVFNVFKQIDFDIYSKLLCQNK